MADNNSANDLWHPTYQCLAISCHNILNVLQSGLSVGGIPVLCHFRKDDLMPVIRGLNSLTFWSLLHVISLPF